MPTPLPSQPDERAWRIVDPVVRLRALETGALFPLPDPRERREATAGPAHLAWDGRRWTLREQEPRREARRGPRLDGVHRPSAALTPGVEIVLGGLTLVAESAALLQLRSLLARLIGWTDDQQRDVDRALRALRDAARLRASLVLCGEGALAPIARRLHLETLGPRRPFVTCGPGDRARALLPRAAGGTLCLDAAAPPADLAETLAETLAAHTVAHSAARPTGAPPARLVLCAPDAAGAAPLAPLLSPTVWIELPPLLPRRVELPRLLADAAADAAAELDQPFAPLRAGDLERLADEPFEGHADLLDAARRLVALRALGATAAAAHLGLPQRTLARWARRRGLGLLAQSACGGSVRACAQRQTRSASGFSS